MAICEAEQRPAALPLAQPTVITAGRWHVRSAMAAVAATRLARCRVLEAEDFDGLERLVQAHPQAALAVLDLHLPGLCLRGGLAQLAARCPAVPWVVFSALGRPSESRALRVPAVYAVVREDSTPVQAAAAVDAALRRTKDPAFAATAGRDADGLTPRQREILQLLRIGCTNKQIASRLAIAEGTVKNHVSDILRTLRASNRTQATAWD